MEHLQRGYIFEGKYRIQGELGRGGFGMVYLAYQIGMDRNVALKVLKPNIDDQASLTARERFLREVKIISKLRHPNTVTIHDFGETAGGLVYMVLEFVDGETLKEVTDRRGAFKDERAARICVQAAKSLSEAHRHGIIHRDLKPANIMLTELGGEEDFVKVLDFGIASLRGGRDTMKEDLTSIGAAPGERQLIGTPRYMSPEQVRGEELTGQSDVYSLGLILYEMLAGEPAVQGSTAMALITQQISPEPLRLGNLNRVHPSLQHIIQRSVAKSMQTRYRSVDVMSQELEQALFEIRRESMGYAGLSDASASGDFLMGNYAGGQFGTGPMPQANPQQNQWNRQSGGFASVSGQHAIDPHLQNNQTPTGPQHYSGQYPAQQPPQQPHYNPNAGPQFQQQSTYNPSGYQEAAPLQGLQGNAPPSFPAQPQPMNQGHYPEQSNASNSASLLAAPDLPPAPSDYSPSAFAPEPELDQAAFPPYQPNMAGGNSYGSQAPPQRPPAQVASVNIEEESTLDFVVTLVTALAMVCALIVVVYILFITLGAAAELIVDGPIRLLGTLLAAIIIPLVPLVAEGGARERFKVVHSAVYKLRRAAIVGVAVNFVSIILLCVFFSPQIVSELRTAPNWFLDSKNEQNESGLATFNRKNSLVIADVIEESMLATGFKDKRDADIKMPEPPAPTRPETADDKPEAVEKPVIRNRMPASTRPKSSDKSTKKKKKPASTRPTKEADKQPDDKKTYVEW